MIEPNTGFYATVVANSVNPYGVFLTSLEVCFSRFILAEFNTHRVLSRNSASSRAIPVAKQLERIKNFPFIPEAFPINKPGMSATEYIYPGCHAYIKAKDVWLRGRDRAIETAEELLALDIHKQIANRVLEPYMYHTVIVSATSWENFYALRISPHAQPEINKIAEMMRDAVAKSVPTAVDWGEWHLPYIEETERGEDGGWSWEKLAKISSGRCAAVTLLNQQKKDCEKDLNRTEGLITNGHMSPLEHPAQAVPGDSPSLKNSNFHPTWVQFRKFIPGEDVYAK